MPFKGDSRLGGRRRNDSTLNGMTEGPNFPAAGTVLSSFVQTYDAGATAQYSVYVEGNLVEGEVKTQNARFNVVADGNGGDYVDLLNPYQITYKPANQVILTGLPNATHYTTINAYSGIITAENGTEARALAHDGTGGTTTITTQVSLYQDGTLIHSELVPYQQLYNDVYYTVGNTTREYRSASYDSNEYAQSDLSLVYLPPGTVVGSQGGSYYVYINGTQYVSGSYGTQIVWAGEYSGLQSGEIYSSYISNGTFIFNDAGYDYYHDGNGGYYYQQSSPSYPSSGTTTGNSSSGTNYININGVQYENGSYSSTEYHDGNGGTYWETSNSYQYNGYLFGYQLSGTDEYGNDTYTYYYSDGNGSYYT